MDRIMEHNGVVAQVAGDAVVVNITTEGACAGCRAREACGMGESQQKTITVTSPQATSYAVGDQVRVGVLRSAGAMAVLLAYVLALVVLLVLLVVGIKVLGWSEWVSILLAFAGLAVYYAVLWLFRDKMEAKIRFTITKF